MLDFNEGVVAVKFARKCIESNLNEVELDEGVFEFNSIFSEMRGAFITIRKDGELRGCIGRPYPEQDLKEALRASAVGAAFEDPRFPSVSRDEFEDIVVEVTVLTEPEEIEVSGRDMLDEVEVGRHGLIVISGSRRGLLLPQVAVEYSWDSMEFLSETCMKAGLLPDAWIEPDTTVQRFEGQIFVEKEPEGDVKEIDIDEGC
ncbi:hypothetical protein AMET1_0518 [Methanonatronarchaeum thermophilum]|uniref:Protein AMET1_0518 n=1 Tax=Methanonatronarchaeum thermophilum TaxID=1927129 RepID=A0A1Y3GC82_9EURY|nr:TIGR00296 family protein [Methanonatronarchaeum thermophilum]OUJ18867.1 hypothetical protein AMET1_0518 [Methanonatronarchaeum thermophilum]